MKKIILILASSIITTSSFAQVFFTKSGSISFNATSKSIDEIKATNKAVACKVNTTTGDVEFVVLVKSFVFANNLMQEHFNEKYLESNTYPKSTFKGKITNLADVNFAKDGTYKTNVSGSLTIHGITKTTTSAGTVTVKGSKVILNSAFNAPLVDYKITVPSAVADKIAKNAAIVVNCTLDPLKK